MTSGVLLLVGEGGGGGGGVVLGETFLVFEE